MLVPLIVLAAGPIFAGLLAKGVFVGEEMKAFWGDSIFMPPQHSALTDAHDSPLWVGLLPLVMGLAGIAVAYWMYVLRSGTSQWQRSDERRGGRECARRG